jgi:hypothetical protein
MDADGGTQVSDGAELTLVERPRGDAQQRPDDSQDARDRRRFDPGALADDERDAGEANADADLVQGAEALVQPARDDRRGEERLHCENQRGHSRRQAPALGVVAAAEIAGVAEQAGDGDVTPLGACRRPARAQPECDTARSTAR